MRNTLIFGYGMKNMYLNIYIFCEKSLQLLFHLQYYVKVHFLSKTNLSLFLILSFYIHVLIRLVYLLIFFVICLSRYTPSLLRCWMSYYLMEYLHIWSLGPPLLMSVYFILSTLSIWKEFLFTKFNPIMWSY